MSNFVRMEKTKKSVYHRGADNGFYLGLLFIMIFCGLVLSEHLGFFSIITIAMILSVPFVAYYFMRKSFRMNGGICDFPSLWIEGIVAFSCGGALLALVAYIFLRFIDPEYIARQVDIMISVYKDNMNDAGTEEIVGMLELIKEHNAYPTPRLISLQLFLTSCFTGSVLSMILAAVVRSVGRVRK